MTETELILKALESGSLALVIVLMYLALRYLLGKLDKLDRLEASITVVTQTLMQSLAELNTSIALLNEQSKRSETETRESIRRVETEMRSVKQ